MSIFTKPSSVAGGSYFKPKEHESAIAILIEPKSIQKDVPNTYKGITSNRDEVTARITVFNDQAALSNGTPSAEFDSAKITHGMLARAAERVIGGAMVARLEMIETQRGAGWAFQDVDGEVEAKAGEYYTKREEALAAAVSSAPGDF